MRPLSVAWASPSMADRFRGPHSKREHSEQVFQERDGRKLSGLLRPRLESHAVSLLSYLLFKALKSLLRIQGGANERRVSGYVPI